MVAWEEIEMHLPYGHDWPQRLSLRKLNKMRTRLYQRQVAAFRRWDDDVQRIHDGEGLPW
jgi:hypothetical protein